MKRFSLLLLCGFLNVGAYADNGIAQYESASDLAPTLNAGKALPSPVVEFNQLTLDSSGDDDINATNYSESSTSGGGNNFNVTVINKTGKPIYVYLSQAQSIMSIMPCTVVSSNTQYNVSQQCHGDPLPDGGQSYLFLSQSQFSDSSSYSSHSADNFLCNASGSVTPQGQASPYVVHDSQGYLAVTVKGDPSDQSSCQLVKT